MFKVGDLVEIRISSKSLVSLQKFNGLRGVVVDPESAPSSYILVRMNGQRVATGWHPHQLVLVDQEAEAREILGNGYFD